MNKEEEVVVVIVEVGVVVGVGRTMGPATMGLATTVEEGTMVEEVAAQPVLF